MDTSGAATARARSAGGTPEAKRPPPREVLRTAVSGSAAPSVPTDEDLKKMIVETHAAYERDKGWLQGVADAVTDHASTLDTLTAEVKKMQASLNLNDTKVKEVVTGVAQDLERTKKEAEACFAKEQKDLNQLAQEVQARVADLEKRATADLETKLNNADQAFSQALTTMVEHDIKIKTLHDTMQRSLHEIKELQQRPQQQQQPGQTQAWNGRRETDPWQQQQQRPQQSQDHWWQPQSTAELRQQPVQQQGLPGPGQQQAQEAQQPQQNWPAQQPQQSWPAQQPQQNWPANAWGGNQQGGTNWKPYDEKFAQSSDNQYDGISNGHTWRRNMANYLIGHLPDAERVLTWAEAQQGQTITMDMLNNSWPVLRTEAAPAVVARHIWNFLNLNLTKDAKVKFKNVERLNGADAWRKITTDISSKSEPRRITLMRKVTSPSQVTKLADTMMGVERWEDDHTSYVESGGMPFSDDQRKGILMGMLPTQVSNQLIWKSADFRNYGELREHVGATLDMIGQLPGTHGHPAHLVEHTDYQDASEYPSEVETFSLDRVPAGTPPEEVLALYNRWQNRKPGGGKGGGKGGGGKGGPPTRKKEDMSCVNCGKKGHAASE